MLGQLEQEFPDLDTALVASVLIDAPNVASARGTLRRIREENNNVRIAQDKLISRHREENSQMQRENNSLRQQLSRSNTAIQDFLEREFPRLSSQVVAITLRDHNYDVTGTREVLRRLSDF